MHPEFGKWVALVEGTLDGPERAAIEEHAGGRCDTCAVREAEVRTLLGALTDDRLLAPSESARQAAYRALRPAPEPATLPRWAAGLTEAVARLVFDSFRSPGAAFAGARSASVARRLCYETDGVELDVLVESEGDLRRITGQLLELRPAGPLAHARFVVLRGGLVDAEGRTNERGELQHELRAPGDVQIRVERGSRLVAFRIPEPFFDAPED